ncbi:MAG: ABC transporter ATP-binding protein [Bdellovibrionota bacterium]|nr:ABC transporter ATP-binding protein [Pseudomonadota bacterium]MDY6091167.1 ABC transporter ATP-binding protein [Bdellovibrionota bacterium]
MKIELKEISRKFKDADSELTIIENLSISFEEKTSFAILGRSGVGKSTLLHILGTLDKPTSGKLLYDNNDITKLNDKDLSRFRSQNIGFIFQFHNLLSDFTALENVAMPLIIAKENEDDAYKKAKEILKMVGLEKRISHIPSKLSGGEQQRVAIARALINNPSIVLGDEPTGSLDVSTSKYIWDMILELNKEMQNTFILVTHNKDLAFQLNKVYEMIECGFLNNLK